MKILWEGAVKPTRSERGRKIFSFLLDYFFADNVRYDSAKPLLHLVQNPVHGRCSTRQEAQILLNPLRQTCMGILVRGESKLAKSVKTFCLFNFYIFQKFLQVSELPVTDPRTRAPCLISRFVPANTVDGWRSPPGLIIKDKISVLVTKLSGLVEECPDIFQHTDHVTIISIPFLCQGVIVKSFY